MATPRYLWRQLNEKQREKLLAWRKQRGYPRHSPPHRPNFGHLRFLISAACFEHHHHIGHSTERMDHFSRDLLAVFAAYPGETFAWCVLPIHYHALVEAPDIKRLLHELGLLHGRTSHDWNGEERARGRKVFFRAGERAMRSDRRYWATLKYIHHNPVRHGYAELLDRLAMEQRDAISGTNGSGRGEAHLMNAAVSDPTCALCADGNTLAGDPCRETQEAGRPRSIMPTTT